MVTHSTMTAIVTRYIGPSNTRGGRIVADGGLKRRVTIPYPHELRSEDAHACAAQALCNKFGWTGDLRSGGTERGCVFVFVEV